MAEDANRRAASTEGYARASGRMGYDLVCAVLCGYVVMMPMVTVMLASFSGQRDANERRRK